VPRRFGYGPRPHRGDRFPRRPCFPVGGFHTRFESRHLDGPHFLRRGSRPTHSNGDVQKIVRVLVAWLSTGFQRFISLTPALSHRPFLILCR
jgi:hypothetical protein